jgi:hypothetical protein
LLYLYFQMNIRLLFLSLLFCCAYNLSAQVTSIQTKVLVVGASTGGIAAGIQSARSGAATVIVEQTNMAGGMLTAAAVSCTDGNDGLKSGMWQEFREALYRHYGTADLASGWVSNNCFEPHAGDSIFKAWAANEKKLKVLYGWYFDKAITSANKITGAEFINIKGERLIVHAVIVIDATDLGDAFAAAGAAFDTGMENPAYSGEKEAIEKSNIIQDLTWAAVLKDYGKGADKTIAKPDGYDATQYYCSTSDAPCNSKPYKLNTQKVLDYGRLTTTDTLHPKYMLNWPAHGNDYYLDAIAMQPLQREAVYQKAKAQTLGFIYFLQTELGFKNIGPADDEVNNGMAWMPYNREGRRVKGLVRLNISHIKTPYNYALYKTGIAVGDYPVDHHHAKYPGKVPAIEFPQIPSFNIPLGALIPLKTEGLIVCEKGISVSNIANGTTRLQPVILLTGQAAGVLAAQCIKNKIQPRQASVRAVQNELLKLKCYLMPFCDVTPDDKAWPAIQQAGILGIIKGTGKSIDWENKTFFYPDSSITSDEFNKSLQTFFGKKITGNRSQNKWLTIKTAKKIINRYTSNTSNVIIDATFWKDTLHLDNFDETRSITRKELAVLFISLCKPFAAYTVDFYGNNKRNY